MATAGLAASYNLGRAAMALAAGTLTARAQATPARATTNVVANVEEQKWNWHVQNTEIVQGDPAFPAKYSGQSSLHNRGEIRETVSLDLFAGVRLWHGAEAHLDGLMWQGFGLKPVGDSSRQHESIWSHADEEF